MTPNRQEPIERQAVRILFILRFCGEEIPPSLFEQSGSYQIDSETKLQKIQFWVRYPDYLAYALLEVCDTPKYIQRRDEIKNIVKKFFRDREPELRTVPMLRHLRGAWESVDRVVTYLVSRDLVRQVRYEYGQSGTRFKLVNEGIMVVQSLLDECPETHWYAERCRLINSFWGHLSGHKLGVTQHSNEIYHNTPIAEIIRPIQQEVRQKFFEVFKEQLPYEAD
jgi:hypothetical protein